MQSSRKRKAAFKCWFQCHPKSYYKYKHFYWLLQLWVQKTTCEKLVFSLCPDDLSLSDCCNRVIRGQSPHLRNCLDRLVCGQAHEGLFWCRRGQPTVESTKPLAGDPELDKNAKWVWGIKKAITSERMSQQAAPPPFLSSNSTLTSLNDGLWPGDISEITISFFSCIVSECYFTTEKETRTT